MTEKAGLPLDMAVFCPQSSVILTFICVIDSNCVGFHSRGFLLAMALPIPALPLQVSGDWVYLAFNKRYLISLSP